jgi:hypothetical protein
MIVGGIVLAGKSLNESEEEHGKRLTELVHSKIILRLIHAVAMISFIFGSAMILVLIFALYITLDGPRASVARPLIVLIVLEFMAVIGFHYYRALKPFFDNENN